jgi:hypothetical protein
LIVVNVIPRHHKICITEDYHFTYMQSHKTFHKERRKVKQINILTPHPIIKMS